MNIRNAIVLITIGTKCFIINSRHCYDAKASTFTMVVTLRIGLLKIEMWEKSSTAVLFTPRS